MNKRSAIWIRPFALLAWLSVSVAYSSGSVHWLTDHLVFQLHRIDTNVINKLAPSPLSLSFEASTNSTDCYRFISIGPQRAYTILYRFSGFDADEDLTGSLMECECEVRDWNPHINTNAVTTNRLVFRGNEAESLLKWLRSQLVFSSDPRSERWHPAGDGLADAPDMMFERWWRLPDSSGQALNVRLGRYESHDQEQVDSFAERSLKILEHVMATGKK